MPRPKKHRTIKCNPAAYYFKPRGIPMYSLEEILLEHDELEAMRLADYLALSQEAAAKKMKISRATFGRIIESARYKLVDGILNGKAIKIVDTLNFKVSTNNKFCEKKHKEKERNNYENSSSNKR